jgi:hypothetical protein
MEEQNMGYWNFLIDVATFASSWDGNKIRSLSPLICLISSEGKDLF